MPKVVKGFKEETSTISYPEAIDEAGRCYLCHDAPCREASPVLTDVAGFISRMRSRNFRGALRLIKETNLFPGITCRVSPYDEQGEAACLHRKYGGPVRIAELERVLADYDRKSKRPYLPEVPESIGKNVAIVGSGPTGLSAAAELVLNGCKVIIYEAARVAGGVFTKGVPSYLISDEVIDHEVGSVLSLGVDLVTGINAGESINLTSIKQSFDALLLTIGMGRAKRLDLESCKKAGIFTGVEILESMKLKEKRLRLGEKILIVGGGNVSMDAAAALLKLEIEGVTVIYRRDREQMPVFESRFNMARHNGMKIMYRTVLEKIKCNDLGIIESVVLKKTELKEKDEGKVVAEVISGSEFEMEADTVIYAIGQQLDRDLVDQFSLETGGDGRIKVKPETNQTSDPFIYAAGSCVERINTITTAIAKGQQVARKLVRNMLEEDNRK
ncbi:MAG: NAD(P)-binding protein [Candidatus Glassbacteria bacterium]|nr:NAD(P)-binding protein [Candidatus Glassbacteria bacterium]